MTKLKLKVNADLTKGEHREHLTGFKNVCRGFETDIFGAEQLRREGTLDFCLLPYLTSARLVVRRTRQTGYRYRNSDSTQDYKCFILIEK